MLGRTGWPVALGIGIRLCRLSAFSDWGYGCQAAPLACCPLPDAPPVGHLLLFAVGAGPPLDGVRKVRRLNLFRDLDALPRPSSGLSTRSPHPSSPRERRGFALLRRKLEFLSSCDCGRCRSLLAPAELAVVGRCPTPPGVSVASRSRPRSWKAPWTRSSPSARRRSSRCAGTEPRCSLFSTRARRC